MSRITTSLILFAISISLTAQESGFTPPVLNEGSDFLKPEKLSEHLYKLDYTGNYNFETFMETGSGDLSMLEFIEKYMGVDRDNNPWACSAFKVKNSRATLVGRNFDWENIPGIILFTSSDSAYSSVSMVPADLMLSNETETEFDSDRLLWAPYFPVEGINERGLAVMELAVEGEKAYNPAKPSMLSLQLIRLLLDYASDTEEAISLLSDYNNTASDRMHFFIADSSGNSAVVEYIDNAIEVSHGNGPWQAVTNTMVKGRSEKKLRKECGRYNYLAQYLESHNKAVMEVGAFNLLRDVSVVRVYSPQFDITSFTQWSVVYDLPEKTISVVSRRNYSKKFKYSLVE